MLPLLFDCWFGAIIYLESIDQRIPLRLFAYPETISGNSNIYFRKVANKQAASNRVFN